jgi:beta-lactamase class D
MFKSYGIDSACFILRDHAHETINLYNRPRCLERFTPASTFKILNSLVALETGIARDETMIIPWNGVQGRPEWNKDMDMREAFKVSNLLYYQELARRVGKQNYQHYLDTIKYGNMKIGPAVDSFWIDNSLQISADEQIGFVRKLYFNELPFLERTQGIVKNMMLREDTANNRFYYKTGTGYTQRNTMVYWVVGYLEHVMRVKEAKESMNKSGVRNYPYFFALNFEVPRNDTSRNWFDVRLKLMHQLLDSYGATRDQ